MKKARRVAAGLVIVASLGLSTYYLPGQPCWGVGRHEGTKATFWCIPQPGDPR